MTQKRVNRGRESYIFGTFSTFFEVLGVKRGFWGHFRGGSKRGQNRGGSKGVKRVILGLKRVILGGGR